MSYRLLQIAALLLLLGADARPQGPSHFGGPGSHGDPRSFSSGKWWTNPMVIGRLNLTDEQQKKIEDTFQQNRIRLIELSADLQKEEAMLEPLLAAAHPVEAKVLAEIDRVADARAALEKANSRMLFAFRTILTPEQWTSLQSPGPGGGPDRRGPGERPRGRD